MATMQVRVQDLSVAIATALKATRVLVNGNAAGLGGLNTAAKSNLVAALNEVKAAVDALSSAAIIDDTLTASATRTYSVTKIRQTVTDAINQLVANAPAALDTLAEIDAALGNDPNFAATMTAALSNRLRFDTATQGLTTQQKANARTNIDSYGSVEIGNPDTDYVAVFTTGLQ